MKRALAAVAIALAAMSAAWGRSPGQAALDRGSEAYKRGDFAEARLRFREAVDLDPSLLKAWENLGWASHRLGDDREAIRIWNTVLKLEPDNLGALNAVGEVEASRSNWAEAAAAFSRSLALNANQPDVRLRLGVIEESRQRLDAAAEQYRTILRSRPGDEKARSRLSDLEESRGRLDEAESVLRAGPGSPAMRRKLARVLAKKGDLAYRDGRFDAARDAYREAEKWDDDDPLYPANLGWAERKAGANGAAIDAWRRAIDRGAKSPAGLWRAIGDAAKDETRFDLAREAYAKAASLDPGGGALYASAALAFETGDGAAADRALGALFARPDLADADYARVAELFIRSGQLDRGEAFFAERARDPRHASAAGVGRARILAARGGEAYRAGDDAAAAKAYRAALAADPHNRAALRDLGWALWRGADWGGVQSAWTRYAAAYPDLAEPHELLGRHQLQHGDSRLAIEEAERALALGPDDPKRVKILLTKSYLAGGLLARARTSGAELAATYPDDLPAQTVYGETLWRNLDFAAAKVQWRKVIDLGGPTPRAMHYWLRSMYETGEYDAAIAEARKLAAAPGATEPVLRLLAEDATVRGDPVEAQRWYERLTQAWPERLPYWLALVDCHARREDLNGQARVLAEAGRHHPESSELAIARAELDRERGHPRRALDEFQSVTRRSGRNRTALLGQVRALSDLGRSEDALALLRSAPADFLASDERALEEATLLDDAGRADEAARLRETIASPKNGATIVPILLYHGLSESSRSLSMPVDNFASQMEALARAGFDPLTVAELDAMLAGRRPFPAKPILITFDDARADSFRYGDPILQRLRLKATMFVPTVRIADESAFSVSWATVRTLAASGRWDFQAHGHLAHDPIPIDDSGAPAAFLVNREWLADVDRAETHDEFARRVDEDYRECGHRLEANVPGLRVIGYAFPFSEMGQLYGGNDPDALEVNEEAFRGRYRYGFVQNASGYNLLGPAQDGPMLLRRFAVPRDWDGARLVAHLACEAPAVQARIGAAESDLWSGRASRAASALEAWKRTAPASEPAVDPVLARAYLEDGRAREAERAFGALPKGPGWDRPDAERERLGRDIGWETDPSAGSEMRIVSDSDGRDLFDFSATGRIPLAAPVDLWGEAGGVRFDDREFGDLSGFQGTIGATWFASAHVTATGWVRGRSLSDDVRTVNGEASFAAVVDRHRFGLSCGVLDIDTAGALRDDVLQRGCQATYRTTGRTLLVRAQGSYRDLTDGNALTYAWGDALFRISGRRGLQVGGRLEVGDSRVDSDRYYAPEGLISALGIARYARAFAGTSSIEVEAGVGPSRDQRAGERIVGRLRGAWTRDWTSRLRTIVIGEYGQTPDYRRTSLAVTLGYRF